MIIGLTGKKGCGKTSAAISMRDHHGYIIRSLATPLKDTLVKFGVPVENMETPGLKETPLEQFGNKSAREVMQLFGTDFARAMISNTIWVDKLRQDIQTLIDSGIEDIVVDDIRFNNEARAIKELCGVIVEVARPDVFDGDSHISERGVSPEFIDGRLENVSSYSSDLDFGVTNMLGRLYE
jgi:dephospho-CoA kinase